MWVFLVVIIEQCTKDYGAQLREKFSKEKESFRIKVVKELKEEKKCGANPGVGNTENLFLQSKEPSFRSY